MPKKKVLKEAIDTIFAKVKGKKDAGEGIADILVRDSDSYVWLDAVERKIDWEELTDGENLCSLQLRGTYIRDAKHALVKGVGLVGALRSVMGIPKKVMVTLTETDSYTDGNVIALGAGFFAASDLENLTKIDLLLGEYIHEGYHILYTDMLERKRKIDEFRTLKKFEKLYAFIHNIVEDERIERKGSEHFPGYTGYIAKIKKYLLRECFIKNLKEELEKKKKEDAEDGIDHTKERNLVAKLLAITHAIIRFPANLLEEDVVKHAKFVKEIQNVFAAKYPETNPETFDCSETIYNIIKDNALEEFEKMEKERKEMEATGGEGDLTKEEKERLKDLVNEITEALGDVMGRATATGIEKAEKLSRSLMISETTTPKESSSSSSSAMHMPVLAAELTDILNTEYFDLEETYTLGTTTRTRFYKAENNISMYNRAREAIGGRYKTLGTLLEREHRDLKLVLKGVKNGHLDTNKFVEAMLGSQTVYENYAYVNSKRVDVVVLADESGSMGGSYGMSMSKPRYLAAMESCVLIKEALKKVKDTDLYMYGFTSDEEGEGTNQIRIYKEPGFDRKYALGSLKARDQNRDGDCIYETAVRVRKFTKNPCLFFVVSDGEPCAAGYGGYTHTKLMVEKVEKMGFVVVQIAITNSVRSEKMFKHFVKFTDAPSLPIAIGGVVKKLLRKLIKAEITY